MPSPFLGNLRTREKVKYYCICMSVQGKKEKLGISLIFPSIKIARFPSSLVLRTIFL